MFPLLSMASTLPAAPLDSTLTAWTAWPPSRTCTCRSSMPQALWSSAVPRLNSTKLIMCFQKDESHSIWTQMNLQFNLIFKKNTRSIFDHSLNKSLFISDVFTHFSVNTLLHLFVFLWLRKISGERKHYLHLIAPSPLLPNMMQTLMQHCIHCHCTAASLQHS